MYMYMYNLYLLILCILIYHDFLRILLIVEIWIAIKEVGVDNVLFECICMNNIYNIYNIYIYICIYIYINHPYTFK